MLCPTCGNEAQFVEEYSMDYCHTCQEYIEGSSAGQSVQPDQNDMVIGMVDKVKVGSMYYKFFFSPREMVMVNAGANLWSSWGGVAGVAARAIIHADKKKDGQNAEQCYYCADIKGTVPDAQAYWKDDLVYIRLKKGGVFDAHFEVGLPPKVGFRGKEKPNIVKGYFNNKQFAHVSEFINAYYPDKLVK